MDDNSKVMDNVEVEPKIEEVAPVQVTPAQPAMMPTAASVGATLANTAVGIGCGMIVNVAITYGIKGLAKAGHAVGGAIKDWNTSRKLKKAAKTKDQTIEVEVEETEAEAN